MRKIAYAMMIVVMLGLMTAGCGAKQAPAAPEEGDPEDGARLKIYASFYPVYFLAREIAGEKGEVVCMVPKGAEPHDWEPGPRTLAELQAADMFIYNGIGMETWADNLVENLDRSKTKAVMASEGIELIKPDEAGGENRQGGFDPHVWVSPLRARKQAENIFKALIGIDPDNKDYYFENYNKLASRLNKLDQDFREASGAFKSDVMVVSYGAFGYLAYDYNLKQVAIRGANPEEELSPSQMAKLVEECKRYGVKYIFSEKPAESELSETLAREIGARTLVLNDAAGLEEEDLEAGKSYITVMYENLENLKKALSEQ